MARDLDERRAALARKKAQLDQEAARIAKADRAWQDRRKIIVGATILNAMEKDRQLFDRVTSHLKTAVTRDSDRKHILDLIGELPPRPASQTAAAST